MLRFAKLLLIGSICVPGAQLAAQGLDPATLLKPATDAWPSYAGDYTQRRFSMLTQIDTANVKHLSLAWVRRLTAGPGGGECGFVGGGGGGQVSTGGIVQVPAANRCT